MQKTKNTKMESKDKPILDSLTAVYSQPPDGCSTEAMQLLTIQTKDAGAGNYFVLNTTEWAFDKPEYLIEILKDFERRFAGQTITKKK